MLCGVISLLSQEMFKKDNLNVTLLLIFTFASFYYTIVFCGIIQAECRRKFHLFLFVYSFQRLPWIPPHVTPHLWYRMVKKVS